MVHSRERHMLIHRIRLCEYSRVAGLILWMTPLCDTPCSYELMIDIRCAEGMFYPKMKILPSLTHSLVVPNLCDLLSSVEHKNIFLSIQCRLH